MANYPAGAAHQSTACLDPYIRTFEAKLIEKNYKPRTIKTYLDSHEPRIVRVEGEEGRSVMAEERGG